MSKTGIEQFPDISPKLISVLVLENNSEWSGTCTGLTVFQNTGNEAILNQHRYFKRLKGVLEDALFNDFVLIGVKVARLSHSSPECFLRNRG